MNAIKGFATSFSSLTLDAINLLLWKKILSLTLFKISTVSRPSTLLRVFDMGRLVCPAKRECGSHCGGLPANPKVLTFSFSWISRWPKIKSPCPSLDHRPHIGEKVPRLTNFTSNVTCGIYFQSHNHDWFEKAHWN